MRSEKGGANMLRTLSLFEKYKTKNDDVGGKRRYCRNTLQWSQNDFKSKKSTNSYYYKGGDNLKQVAVKWP